MSGETPHPKLRALVATIPALAKIIPEKDLEQVFVQ
jgi:hypothetical protein